MAIGSFPLPFNIDDVPVVRLSRGTVLSIDLQISVANSTNTDTGNPPGFKLCAISTRRINHRFVDCIQVCAVPYRTLMVPVS